MTRALLIGLMALGLGGCKNNDRPDWLKREAMERQKFSRLSVQEKKQKLEDMIQELKQYEVVISCEAKYK